MELTEEVTNFFWNTQIYLCILIKKCMELTQKYCTCAIIAATGWHNL